MHKLEAIEPSNKHIEKWGGFNEAPPVWQKISAQELVQETHFSQHTPDFIEYRQILNSGKMIAAHLYYYWDGTGIGIECDYWGKAVNYYRFGCNHSYSEMGLEECRKQKIFHNGGCYHVYKCSKCGNINAVDSSG